MRGQVAAALLLLLAQCNGEHYGEHGGGTTPSMPPAPPWVEEPPNTTTALRKMAPMMTNISCTLVQVSFGTDLGTLNATDTTYFACDTRTENSTRYHLEVSSATEQIVSDVRPFDQVTLVLAEQTHAEVEAARSEQKAVGDFTGRPKFYRVVKLEARGHVTRARQLLAGDGHYFAGEVRFRLLSVIVVANGFTADYAGKATAEREAWVAWQRTAMDEQFRWSTYGKIGFDHTNSIVRTVDVGTLAVSQTCCQCASKQLIRAAAAKISSLDFEQADAVLYYNPKDATQAACSGLGGSACELGVLHPSRRFVPQDKSNIGWRAGCWVGNQDAALPADLALGLKIRGSLSTLAQTSSHEFGHHLGLNHAGGSMKILRATGKPRLTPGPFAWSRPTPATSPPPA